MADAPTVRWFLHETAEYDEIKESVGQQLDDAGVELTEQAFENLCTEIRHRFYEIAFELTVDPVTGAIENVELEPDV